MTSSFSIKVLSCSWLIKDNSKPNNKRVSNSVNEPRAICKNWINSLFDFLAAPSAILTGTETDARFICETNPYRSSAGNICVIAYTSFTNSKLLIHAFKFLCGLIANFFTIQSTKYYN